MRAPKKLKKREHLVNAWFPIKLLEKVDAAAREEFATRSEWLRAAALDRLRRQRRAQPAPQEARHDVPNLRD
jgi:hypothetical protein